MISRTKCIVAAALLAAMTALCVHFLCIAIDAISGFSGCFFLFAPTLFIFSITGDADVRTFAMCAFFVVAYGGLAVCYSLHVIYTAGYVTEDSAKTWLEMGRSASQLYILPFFFGCIRKRTARGRQRAASTPFVVTLPGGIVAGLTFLPRSLMDKAVRSKECRAAAHYYCSYVIHCVCTLAPAAAAALFGLIEAETSFAYVTVCSALSIALCLPLFFVKPLNTPAYTSYVNWALVPALAATFLLQAYGGAEIKQIGEIAAVLRNLLWIAVVPLTLQANFAN